MTEQLSFFDDPNAWTVAQARDYLRERAVEGAICPCCEGNVKVYPRHIHSKMASDLIRFHREVGTEWGHLRTLFGNEHMGDWAKLRYWQLIVESDDVREDGSRRAGVWKITELGERYVHDDLRVPYTARVYGGRVLEMKGDRVGIRDALGTAFSYDELMGNV